MEYRRHLEILKSLGRLVEIDEEVDWRLEATCIADMLKRMMAMRGESYCVMFNNLKGYKGKGRLVYGTSLPKFRRFWEGWAIALGLPVDISWEDFRDELYRRELSPIKPIEVTVADAPCKQFIKLGEEANLLAFPFPLLHRSDGGRYSTCHGLIDQDPDTGWINIGDYRFMIKGPRRAGMLFELGQHGPTIFYQKYDVRGETMPFCLALGGDSLELIAYSCALPAGMCEYDFIGALRGEPEELVRAETNNLLVPARAEIIIEGEVPPRERHDEGPFVEYSGFAHGRHLSPVFKVNAITHRDNPIMPMALMGILSFIDDGGSAMRMSDTVAMFKYFSDLGFSRKEVQDALCGGETPEAFIFVKGETSTPQRVQEIMQALYTFKNAIYWFFYAYVDSDTNLVHYPDVMEQVGLNFDPRTFKLYQSDLDSFMNPLVFFTDAESRFKGKDAAKVSFDCSTKFKDPKYVWRKDTFDRAYPAHIRERVKAKWDKWGFDQPFTPRREGS
jgi:4-hydroxy-3-polyprenylbenzoate decarboxylase